MTTKNHQPVGFSVNHDLLRAAIYADIDNGITGTIPSATTKNHLVDSIMGTIAPFLASSKREVQQPVACREAFEIWSKEQGWEVEGYPDARQRWTVWKSAWDASCRKREVQQPNDSALRDAISLHLFQKYDSQYDTSHMEITAFDSDASEIVAIVRQHLPMRESAELVGCDCLCHKSGVLCNDCCQGASMRESVEKQIRRVESIFRPKYNNHEISAGEMQMVRKVIEALTKPTSIKGEKP